MVKKHKVGKLESCLNSTISYDFSKVLLLRNAIYVVYVYMY